MTSFTPFTIQAVANRIASILDEQQTALIRTAFSAVVRESEDLACGLFNAGGQMIAQSITGTPGHINSMATGVRHFLQAFPPARLEPGDVLITNDPWKTAGQVNDFTVVTPVFVDDRPIAYFASTCHAPDIGGRQFSGDAREVFEEGLQIPMLKILRAGEPNQDVIDIVRMNVRRPDETIGDIYAQVSSNEVGVRRLTELLDEFGLHDVEGIGDEVISRSEQAMRAGIAALPDGMYTNEAWTDGFDEPVLLRCTIVVDGDELTVDWAGSSDQSSHGINLVLNYTHAYTSYAMKAALAPDVPHNDGAFRPVHVTAPLGSILNCEHPAPVASRHVIGHFLPGIIFGALAPALPGRLPAGSADALWITVWQGRDRGNESFVQTMFQLGGMGARATKDGLSATGFPSGVAGMPAEVVESLSPLLLHTRELIPDSGGAGRSRGGLGQARTIGCATDVPWSVSGLLDRTRYPAPGLDGGGSGGIGAFRLLGGDDLPPKRVVTIEPDARVELELPGGGGFGDPFLRAPARVLDDVVDGYVSIERARSEYGVVIRYVGTESAIVRPHASYELDVAATEEARR